MLQLLSSTGRVGQTLQNWGFLPGLMANIIPFRANNSVFPSLWISFLLSMAMLFTYTPLIDVHFHLSILAWATSTGPVSTSLCLYPYSMLTAPTCWEHCSHCNSKPGLIHTAPPFCHLQKTSMFLCYTMVPQEFVQPHTRLCQGTSAD